MSKSFGLMAFMNHYNRIKENNIWAIPEYELNTKKKLVEALMKFIDANQISEAADLLQKTMNEDVFNTSSDPILGTLRVRVQLLTSLLFPPDHPLRRMYRTGAHSDTIFVVNHVAGLRLSLFDEYPNERPPEIETLMLQLTVIHQYINYLVLSLSVESEGNKVGAWRRDWRKLNFGAFYDYTGIDPFILRLCPPQDIWTHYLLDGRVHYWEGDTLMSKPIAEWDLVQNPPQTKVKVQTFT